MLEFLFFFYLISGSVKGLLSAYGVTSPLDITLLSGLLVFLYALFGRQGGKWKQKVRNGLWDGRVMAFSLGGFLIWCGLSAWLWTPSEDYAIWKYIVLFTNVLAFSVPLIERNFKVNLFIKWFCAYSILYGIMTYFTYGLLRLDLLWVLGLDRPDLLQRMYLMAGFLLGISGILILYLKNRWSFILLNLILYLLIATAARGSTFIFFFVLGALGVFYCFKTKKWLRSFCEEFFFTSKGVRWMAGFAGANLLLILLILNSQVLSSPYQRAYLRYNVLVEKFTEGPTDSSKRGSSSKDESKAGHSTSWGNRDRLEEYAYVLKKGINDPLHFTIGYGFGSFNLLMYGTDGRGYPHNVLLEIWFELGMIGVLLAVLFLGRGIYRMLRNDQVILFFAVLFILGNAMKSYSFVDLRILFALLAIGAFISVNGIGEGIFEKKGVGEFI